MLLDPDDQLGADGLWCSRLRLSVPSYTGGLAGLHCLGGGDSGAPGVPAVCARFGLGRALHGSDGYPCRRLKRAAISEPTQGAADGTTCRGVLGVWPTLTRPDHSGISQCSTPTPSPHLAQFSQVSTKKKLSGIFLPFLLGCQGLKCDQFQTGGRGRVQQELLCGPREAGHWACSPLTVSRSTGPGAT